MMGALFLIYPIIYLYSRDLVFANSPSLIINNGVAINDKTGNRFYLFFIFALPITVLIFVSILYYPLDSGSQIKFIEMHYAETSSEIFNYKTFQYFIIPAYYLQTAFYMILSLRLIAVVKTSINSHPWELLIVRYILFYVIGVIIYESLMVVNAFVMINNIALLLTIEMLLTMLFIAAGLYIGFKQSLILLQSRIAKYSNKFNDVNETHLTRSFLLESEKIEIKVAIEDYFYDSKIYLNPNLKLEELSKKIHIPVKKISSAVNELYGKNFIGFMNSFRISAAKKILSENHGDIKIENVYTKVGFNSRSTFNRVFKSLEGITPIEFISALKQNNSIDNE